MSSFPQQTYFDVPFFDATQSSIAGYGVLIGAAVHKPGLAIPFYPSVEEGENLDFSYHERAVVRTARISKRSSELRWFERHMRMTQIFIGLGDQPFVMVLAKPNHAEGGRLPDFSSMVAFRIAAGHGIMIHRGTWHDFPMAIQEPVTVFTVNSEEVVKALCAVPAPQEIDDGDVFKIDIVARTGRVPRVPF